jgi:hypothetical protein
VPQSVIHKNGMKELGKMFLRIGQALEDEENGTRSGHTVPEKMAKKLERKILQQENLIIKERKNKEQLVLDDLAAAEKLRFERDEPDAYLVKSMNCKDIKERLKKEFKCKLTIPSETGGKPVNMKMQQLSELLIEKLKEKRINDSINRIAVDNNVI